ncbi:hypothetical protein JR316_0005851 [Psilocybe cubensis]|uniref:Uncharacterized protein n=2 Tax=Psilocybe cubensis TaxID=181762 RepID=A0ACB8H0G5_PSICU|nr:hypothetical protein JR316_0005851 [Psilocybe cubensis]KAH9481329.1 hypothetical protein JR316_0005851 [Psilocybe cubensis]
MASRLSIQHRLPLEVIEHIIDQFADYNVDPDGRAHIDAESLKACSLTCQAFLPRARKHIFHSFVLIHDVDVYLFANFIHDFPELAHYVRFLYYVFEPSHTGNPLIPAAFQRLTKLTSINLVAGSKTWHDVPRALRTPLLNLIRFPSIRYLRLEDIYNIAPYELFPCPNLKELELSDVLLRRPGKPAVLEVQDCKPAQLERLQIEGRGSQFVLDMLNTRDAQGNPVLDLEQVTDYTVYRITNPTDFYATEEVMMQMPNLEKLHIACSHESSAAELVEKYSLAYINLKTLQLGFDLLGDDTLSSVCTLLRSIKGRNPIQSLQLDILDSYHYIPNHKFKFALDKKLSEIEEIFLQPSWDSITNLTLEIIIPEGVEDGLTSWFNHKDQLPLSFKQDLEDKIKDSLNQCFKKLSEKKPFKFDYVIEDLQDYEDSEI